MKEDGMNLIKSKAWILLPIFLMMNCNNNPTGSNENTFDAVGWFEGQWKSSVYDWAGGSFQLWDITKAGISQKYYKVGETPFVDQPYSSDVCDYWEFADSILTMTDTTGGLMMSKEYQVKIINHDGLSTDEFWAYQNDSWGWLKFKRY